MYKKMMLIAGIATLGAIGLQACCGDACSDENTTKEKVTVKLQEKCPFMGGKVNKSIYSDHNGKRVYFCCQGCVGPFNSNPEKYIKQIEDTGVTLTKTPKNK